MLNGSIEIQFNTFLLADYMQIIHTDKLIALTDQTGAFADEDIAYIKQSPTCYAYNAKSSGKLGSFGLYKDGGALYAVSNAHVFLESAEFYAFAHHTLDQKNIVNTRVMLVIEKNPPWEVEIDKTEVKLFNNYFGIDFCRCRIPPEKESEISNAYKAATNVAMADTTVFTAFGARSKNFNFKADPLTHLTACTVEYNGFDIPLDLYKLSVHAAIDGHINFGDSGSFVNYYDQETKTIKTGIIVAKSDYHAYMFKLDNAL
jgi:hypothetical protein